MCNGGREIKPISTEKSGFAAAGRLPLAFLCFAVVLILNSFLYLPFLSDDALISMRYSQRLSENGTLTWTDGQPVEGYSNLLWVLLTAGGISAGIDAVTAVRLIGMICMLFFLLCVLFEYRKECLWCYMPVLLVSALSAPLAVWAIGGLEQPLVAALLALAVPLIWRLIDNRKPSFKAYLLASIPLALLCITRPDGALFTFSAVVVLLFAGHSKKSFILAFLPILFVAAQMGFRLHYYGDYLPNTARIKMQPSFHYFLSGAKYVLRGLFVLFPLSFISVVATVKAIRRKHIRTLLPAVMSLVWLGYLLVIGGDIFPAYRHFVPIVVLFTWISIEGLLQMKFSVNRKTVTLMVTVLLLFTGLQVSDSRNREARLELWEWDGRVISLALKEAFSEQQPLLAVTAAGSLPFWSELPSLDMLGLNDRYLAIHQGDCAEEGLLGHNVCNPGYVLERKPDIVSFNVAGEPSGLAIAESLSSMGEFTRLYGRISFRGDYPYTHQGLLWFNRESPFIGIVKTEEFVEIPAYFLNMHSHTVVTVKNGVPVVSVSPGRPAGIVLTDMADSSDWIAAETEDSLDVQLVATGDSLVIELFAADSVHVSSVRLMINQ